MARRFRLPDPAEVQAEIGRLTVLTNAANRNALTEYVMEESNRISMGTIRARLDPLIPLGLHLGDRTWMEATRADVIQVISTHTFKRGAHKARNPELIKPKLLAPSTRAQWAVHVQTFYRHLLDTDDVPPMCKRLPFKRQNSVGGGVDLAIHADEFVRLFGAAQSKRDRALLIILFEGGFRIGEAAAIRLDGIEDRGHALWITLPDEPHPGTSLKTGPREVAVPIIAGKGIVMEWLAEHPRRHERAIELFLTQSARSTGKPMTGKTLGDVIKRCAKRAGLEGISSHALRKGSTTLKLAQGWSPDVVRQIHGWSPRSTIMTETYAKLAPHFEAMVLRAHGLEPTEEPILDILGAKACLVCGEKIPIEVAECPGCHVPAARSLQVAQVERRHRSVLEYAAPAAVRARDRPDLADGPPGIAIAFLEAEYRAEVRKQPAGAEFVDWCIRLSLSPPLRGGST